MADARRAILDALRAARPPAAPHPGVPAPGAPPADPPAQFLEAVKAVGGTGIRVPDAAALRAELAKLAATVSATKIVIAAAEAGQGTVALDALPDPHALEGVDLAVLPGLFGVAENGAVWVDTRPLRHRGVFVVAQHLALVVPAREIVTDLHAAYARIDLAGPGLRLFIAGPSKTADIEQSLVIGAHGARSCIVFLVG